MKKSGIATTLLLLLAGIFITGCGVAAVAPAPTAEQEPAVNLATLPDSIDVETVAAIQGMDDVLLIDVREQYEYDEAHIPGVTLIPMGDIPARLNEIPQDQTVILTCRSGNRSGQVTDYLRAQGYENVHNMSGGIVAWSESGLPTE